MLTHTGKCVGALHPSGHLPAPSTVPMVRAGIQEDRHWDGHWDGQQDGQQDDLTSTMLEYVPPAASQHTSLGLLFPRESPVVKRCVNANSNQPSASY